MPAYQAIIVGAGPGGLATVLSLLDAGLTDILWVDRTFGGGRLNELYREISSNTKVHIYLDAIESSSTARGIVKRSSSPNAVDTLRSMDPESTCMLSVAGDMIVMLERGALARDEVTKYRGEVSKATYNDSQWHVELAPCNGENGSSSSDLPSASAPRLFLCTGSHPVIPSFHRQYAPNLKVLDLDECMRKSHLPSLFPRDKQSVVGVIGNSHSGILVCRNLYETAREGSRDLRILNFRRRGIKFAEYRDDGIVYDNTGLKGDTAEWAKEVMRDPDHTDATILEQVDLGAEQEGREKEVYAARLGECTHLVYAVGYERNPYPALTYQGESVQRQIEFDQHTSGFHLGDKRVPGLFGLGIAHPEKTEDPEGHVEAAVGVAKFFKFAERVKGEWVKAA
ncbi:hypothetical protein IAU60_005473 [Kwoniella sp. DSM 27419]